MKRTVTLKTQAFYWLYVSEPIRVPDPVYSRATSEAERQDVSRGVIVKQWMEAADKLEDVEARHR